VTGVQTCALPISFTIARSSEDCARNVLVTLRAGRHQGFGEAAPQHYYGQGQAGCLRTLRRMAPLLREASPFDLEHTVARLARSFPDEPAARAAVDIALHDLLGKSLGLPLWKYWGLDPDAAPRTSFTIGIDTLEMVRRKVAEAERYPILKIKLGVKNDLEIMREVRRLCPRKTLRVDANCGWTVREAIAKARVLERLGVEFIEQPVPAGNPAALKRIQDRIGLPLFADESSCVPEDIPALRGCVKGINVKLVKCGGLLAARKMIHTARACRLRIMLGCMIESSVLITAAAHLAPLVDYADLDGALLLARDPFRGVRYTPQARMILPRGPGLGVRPAAG
jgi:L-alanine-DL-glutamate epimerase-like enolase superfamily enzyme